jgi:hypothetical protein
MARAVGPRQNALLLSTHHHHHRIKTELVSALASKFAAIH